jgi:hypothetical protein
MKRIALIGTVTAAMALFGVVNTSSAETTVPIEDLTLVSETSTAATPVADNAEPDAMPRFQFPRFQYPHFQFPHFQFPHFQFPHFQFPHFQFPHFQLPHFQFPRR